MAASLRSALALAVVLLLAPRSLTGQAPTIAITSVPPYAVNGFLSGTVAGVDFATHRVAVYIYVDGLGWFTKPTFASPTVTISPTGAFTADVATGGIDNRATIYCAAVVPADVAPPLANAAARIPASLPSLALDCEERYGRTLEFAGWRWAVKEAPAAVGPGGNRFSDRPEDAFVDRAGRLHLTVTRHDDGFWYATEVVLLDRPGFGTYAFETASRVDDLDPQATFGAFTWDPYGDEEGVPRAPNREIDLEDSRWCRPEDPTNSQFVLQPFDVGGNLERYTLPDLSTDPALARAVTWRPERVEFVARHGGAEIRRFSSTADPALNHFVPTAGRAAFRFNLWLNNVEVGCTPPPPVPARGARVEVIVSDFTFEPLACALDVDGNGVVETATDVVYIARHLFGISPVPPSFRASDPTIPSDALIGARVTACLP